MPLLCFAGSLLWLGRCNVVVHQHCYGRKEKVERGRAWLCDVCGAGEVGLED